MPEDDEVRVERPRGVEDRFRGCTCGRLDEGMNPLIPEEAHGLFESVSLPLDLLAVGEIVTRRAGRKGNDGDDGDERVRRGNGRDTGERGSRCR